MRHGNGVFAKKGFKAGEVIGPAIKGGNLTNLSRYMNHSAEPNTEHFWQDGDAYISALNDILSGDELTISYRKTLIGMDK